MKPEGAGTVMVAREEVLVSVLKKVEVVKATKVLTRVCVKVFVVVNSSVTIGKVVVVVVEKVMTLVWVERGGTTVEVGVEVVTICVVVEETTVVVVVDNEAMAAASEPPKVEHMTLSIVKTDESARTEHA